jgi:hypothetical protein
MDCDVCSLVNSYQLHTHVSVLTLNLRGALLYVHA